MNKIEIYKNRKLWTKIIFVACSLISLLLFYLIFTDNDGGGSMMILPGVVGFYSVFQYLKLKETHFAYDEQNVSYKMYQSKQEQTIAFSDIEAVDINSKNIIIHSNTKEQDYQIPLALLNSKEKQTLKNVFAKFQ